MKTWCPVPPPQKDGQDKFWVMGDLFNWVLNRGGYRKAIRWGDSTICFEKIEIMSKK